PLRGMLNVNAPGGGRPMDDGYRFVNLSADDTERVRAMERDLTRKYGREIVLIAYEKTDSPAQAAAVSAASAPWMEAAELGRLEDVPTIAPDPEDTAPAPKDGREIGLDSGDAPELQGA